MRKDGPSLYLLYFFSLILAFCSLVYELLIAQTMATLAANTVIWFSVTVGLYLCSMGMGSLVCHRLTRKTSAVKVLCLVEVLLSLIGCLVVICVHSGHMLMSFFWVRELFAWGLGCFYFIYGLVVIAIGFLTGLEVPLLIALARERKLTLFKTNRLLAFDYFGSLLAGLVFPLCLLPFFNLFFIGASVAILNLVIAFLLGFDFASSKNYISKLRMGMVGVFVLFVLFSAGKIEQYFMKKYYFYKLSAQNLSTLFSPMKDIPTPERIRSQYQTIDILSLQPYDLAYRSILKSFSSRLPGDVSAYENRGLYINGAFQLWSNFEELYHEYFAHVPLILNKQLPRDVLVLGAGDGMLVRELIKYKMIEKITVVELDREMIHAAKNEALLKFLNNQALDDARVEIVVGDAYHYLKNNKHLFDAIYMDFPEPQNFDLSKLYTQEFYSFVYQSLKPQGFAVCNALRLGLSFERDQNKNGEGYQQWSIYFSTLKSAGFKTIIPFSSQLETDNMAALQVFKGMIGDAQELVVRENSVLGDKEKVVQGQEEIVTQLLTDFVHDYTQRFIFVKKDKETFDYQYRDPGIALFILNEKRFNLAFDPVFNSDEYQNKAYVNSILRPTIPDMSFWWRVKLPYR